MKLFAQHQDDSLLLATQFITGHFQIKATKTYLSDQLEKHIDFPSLLTVKDVLFEYGIETAAVRKGTYAYVDFETPFICTIQKEDWGQPVFTVVTSVSEEEIQYLDPLDHKLNTISISAFEKIDKEIILLLDESNKKDEHAYDRNRKIELTAGIIKQIPLYFVLFSTLFAGFQLLNSPLDMRWINLFFLFSSLTGTAISLLLLWHEVDAHNPFIKEVCGAGGKKSSCNAVLSSSGSMFLNINWSIWGFTYFTTFFLSQVFFPANAVYTTIWSVLSIAAGLYVFYSLYYQWKIVKQWCPLCLGVQAVLFVNLLLSVFHISAQPAFSEQSLWHPIFSLLFIGISITLMSYYAIPLLKSAGDSKNYEKRWKKLRYHPDLFQVQLIKNSPIIFPVENIGIVIGNPLAQNEIVKVCNPYCGPCSSAHPELEHIIKNNPNVKVRVIFTATGEDNDIKTAPVRHLLAIQQRNGDQVVHKALDDWYLANQKDYKVFAEKYPVNGELEQQKDKILAMRTWCNQMKIRATPTIYVNGYELPDSYRVSELKNFF